MVTLMVKIVGLRAFIGVDSNAVSAVDDGALVVANVVALVKGVLVVVVVVVVVLISKGADVVSVNFSFSAFDERFCDSKYF